MKYRSKFDSIDFLKEKDLLSSLLRERGVEDVNSLLNLSEDCIHDGMLLKNMREALNIFDGYICKAMKEKVRIGVVIDEDVDGYTSAAMITNYIKDIVKQEGLHIEMVHIRHGKKFHGIDAKKVKATNVDLLIVPDAGSNDIEECRELNMDIIILDHHNIERENQYATVVNCKDGEYPNNTLSGAGVVYKFCKEYDKGLDYDFADNYLDLFALGNIGDIMDLRNEETRYLTLKGIKQMNIGKACKFINEIIVQNSYSLGDEVTIKGVGWTIAPLINAVTRVGTEEERNLTFRALLGDEETIEHQPRRKKKTDPQPPVELIPLYRDMVRQCGNIRNRQNKIAEKGMKELENNIIPCEKMVLVEATDTLEKDFTGLVANKLASKYRKPVLILKRYKDDLLGGSGRNCKLSPIEDLNKFLTSLELFNKVAGHDNSFGIEICRDNIERLPIAISEALKDVVMEDVYIVDYEIPIGRLKLNHIEQVGKWQHMWGNKLDEPLFAITDVHVKPEDIKLLGEKKNFIKIEVRNFSFIKKFTNQEEHDRMLMRNSKGLNKNKAKRLKFDFICKFTLNKWEDNIVPQIEIVDFNVTKDSQVRF